MQYGYLLKISNKNIYKEVQIPVDAEIMKIGMGIDCDVRFYKESFFEDFELVFQKKSNEWNITCSDNVFIDAGDVRKLITKKLSHGDSFAIKYQKSENEVFKIDFVYDFDNENKDYSRIIDITSKDKITIGNSSSCNICINSEYVKDDLVELNKKNEDLILAIKSTTCGVYHNGNLAVNGEVIKNGDFFSIANFSFYYKENQIYTAKNITIISLNYRDVDSLYSTYPKFNRNTRIKTQLDTEAIQVLDPPNEANKPKGNILLQLLPALGMIALTVVVRGFMGNSSNSSFLLFSVCSMGMGIVTSVISMISERKKYKEDVENRIVKYNEYINEKREQIKACRQTELQKLNDIYVDTNELSKRVLNFSGEIFDKTVDDDDFLKIYIGRGSVDAEKKISFKKQERFASTDELVSLPEHLNDEYKKIDNAPIFMNCKDDNVIGVIGSNNNIYSFVKNIVTDICSRHYYKDVQIYFLINENEVEKYEKWLRWFPHIYNDRTNSRNIVYNDESKNQIFEQLFVNLSSRSNSKNATLPYNIIFVLEDWGIKTHPVSQFIKTANNTSSTFIFFESKKDELPLGCNEVLFLENNNTGKLLNSSKKDEPISFTFETIDDLALESISKKLAPVFCEEISLENALTKNITLYEMFNILSAEDINLQQRWATSTIYKSMSAPLGVKTKDEIVNLDLHEKAHGPHGLVAGTTGSGKSEILQTYILSMATLFHPYEVGFVIIDFKGGGMVNQFKTLPHLIGAITNIDGREINRSLMSIKAELQKRQRLFAENGVNNINNYIKLYKAGKIEIPIPHLILIVDEFAELKAEQPEFMKELISAARIGRSLGVHLILATQKPSGQVNEQIWSNSRFKLCLKVQDQQDSNEVLKSPLAAEIKEPGRAYLQVGNNEIFELFQSAYSGAPAHNVANSKEYHISEVSLSGKRKVVFSQRNKKTDGVVETQLDAIVSHVHKYCEDNSIVKLPDICLPSLKDSIPYPTNFKENKKYNIPIGIYDDPANQQQPVATVDLSSGNIAIIGSSQYGKTNLLQLFIKYLTSTCSPDELNLYILDFGSMALKVFDKLNHVGGVVTSSDDEKIKNFFRLMNKEVAIRKDKFAKLGITSYNSYCEAGYSDIPQIAIAIDYFIAMKELYADYEDDLLNLCREGTSLGICLVFTSLQTNGINYKYMSNFPTKICMYCNSSDEYNSLFDRCRIHPKNVPGRSLIEVNKDIFECQTYLAFNGEREIDRVNEIQEYIINTNKVYPNDFAKRIPEVPAELDTEYVTNNYKDNNHNYVLPVGIDYDTVEFVTLDLSKTLSIAISGREHSGKSNFVKLIMDYCQNEVFDCPVKAYLIDSYEKGLYDFSSYGFVERYTIDTNETDTIFESIETELIRRKNDVQEFGIEQIANEPLLLCVIENNNIFEANGISKQAVETYKRIVTNYKHFKVLFVFSDVPNLNIGYSSPEMLKQMKEVNLNFCFDDLTNTKLIDFNATIMRCYKKPIELGDSYRITPDGSVIKLKTIKS